MRALALSTPASRLLLSRLPPNVAMALAEELEDAGDPGSAFRRWFNNPDFQLPLTSSMVPTKGFGASSFVRATTRTVTDHEGKPNVLLAGEVGFQGARRVRNTVATTSFDFTNAAWTKSAAGAGTTPVVANEVIARPDGSVGNVSRVTLVNAGGTAADHSELQQVLPDNTTDRAFSVYVKSATGVPYNVQFRCRGQAVVATVTAAWQRLSVVAVAAADATNWIALRGTTGTDAFADIHVWGWQVEDVTSQQNKNPGEYVPVGAPKLNDFISTEILNVANGWAFSNAVTSSTTVAAYDGRTVGAKLDETAVSAGHAIFRTTAKPSAAVYTYGIQCDLKAGERTWGVLRIDDTVANGMEVYFDLTNGVLGGNTAIGAGFTVVARSMRALGNGWYRCFAALQTNATANINPQVLPATANGTSGYLGVVGNGINIAYPMVALGATAEMAYFPVGNVYPYSGSGVDGVKCFEFYNGNTVTANVVTAGTGPAIGQTKNQSGRIPAISGAYYSTPDAAANRIVNGIMGRIYLAPDLWAPGGERYYLAKSDNASNQRSWVFGLGAAGQLILYVSLNGTTYDGGAAKVSTANVSFAPGTTGWIGFTRDDVTGNITFYTSQDGATWTQLGAVVASTAGALFNASTPLEVGGFGAGGSPGTVTAAVCYRAQVYNGINGTLAVDFNPNDWATGATLTSSSTREVWTLNGGANILNFPLAGYLPEQASTNLCLQSENFGTTWVAASAPTRTAAALRCGSVFLDLIGDNSAVAIASYTQAITFTGDAVKAISLFFAQGTATTSLVQLNDATATADRLKAAITWASGIPTVTMTTGTLLGLDSLANGVFRVRMATTAVTAANVNNLNVYPANTAAGDVAQQGTIYMGGVQAENSTSCSSYIGTTAATVTRNPDVLTDSITNIVAANGAAYAECQLVVAGASAVGIGPGNVGGGSDVVLVFSTATNCGISGPAGTATKAGLTDITTGIRKRATKWDAAAGGLFATGDGAVPASGLFTPPLTLSASIGIGCQQNGGNSLNGTIRNVRIWRTAPPDSYLQRATA
jgi:hypothetical protein